LMMLMKVSVSRHGQLAATFMSGSATAEMMMMTMMTMMMMMLMMMLMKVSVSRHGQLAATFMSGSVETWRLSTARGSIIADDWQYVELSWHPDKGAYVHIAKRRLTAVTAVHTTNITHR